MMERRDCLRAAVLGFAVAAIFGAMLIWSGCTTPHYELSGPQTRIDGTPVPAPSYTNVPEVFREQ